MAINELNKDKIITLEGLNTFREKNALNHFAKESVDSQTFVIIKGCDETNGRLESDKIRIGSTIRLLASTNVTGTLDATTLKQNGSAVALASQIPSGLNTKVGLINEYNQDAGGWSIGDESRVLNLVGTQIRINGNLSALDWTVATAEDINAIFS